MKNSKTVHVTTIEGVLQMSEKQTTTSDDLFFCHNTKVCSAHERRVNKEHTEDRAE